MLLLNTTGDYLFSIRRFGLYYEISQRFIWLVAFVSMKLFCKFYVKGKENLKLMKVPLLVISNHRSSWDPLIVGTLMPFFKREFIPMGFMAADRLFKNPFLKIYFKLIWTFPAHKGEGLDVSLAAPRRIFSRNGVFLMFPFGGIVLDEKESKVGAGCAQLVKDFPNLTILPVHLNTRNLSLKEFLFYRREMGMIVGKPFSFSENAAKDMTLEEIGEVLKRKILSLKE